METTDPLTREQLLAENAELKARLAEAEETLRAIREGEVDAVIVTGSKGDRVFALSEADNLHRLMVEFMDEAGLAATPDGLLMFCNDRAATLLDRPKDQLLGQDLGQFVAADSAARFRELLQVARNSTADGRIEFLTPEGTVVPMHLWASPLARPEGPLVCLVATDLTRIEADRELIARLQQQQEQLRSSQVAALNLMQDADAARRAAEQAKDALLASEQRMQQALRVSHSFTFEWQPLTDRVVRSDSCAEILNLSGDEAVNDTGQNYFQRVHHDDRAPFVKMLGSLSPGAADYTTEYRVVRDDGRVVVLEETGRATFDAVGKLERLFGVSTDITARKQAQEALQRSESLLRTVLDSSPDPIFLKDRDSRLLLANPATFALIGKPPEVCLGKTDAEFYDDAAAGRAIMDNDRRIMDSGEMENIEESVTTPAGRRVYLSAKAPYRDAQGRVIGIVGVARDITARKQAEEAVRESEERLAESQRIAHLGSFEFVVATRETVWSDEEYRIYGLDPAGPSPAYELMLAQCIHPDDTARLHETFTRAMQSSATYELEHRIVRPDGSVRWVYDRAQPYFDEHGILLRYVGATLDITERRQAEAALRESEGKYRTLFSNMAEEVHFWQLVRDEAGQIKTWRLVDANPPTLRSWGRQNIEQIRGKTTDEIFGPGATKHYQSVVQKIMTEGVSHTFEDYFPNLDKHFRFTSVPLGEFFITTGADITANKKAELALRQSQEDLARAQAVGQIGSWRLDTRQDVLTWSDENHRIFGVPKGTPLTYEAFLGVVHPDDRAYVDAQWNAGLRGEPYDIEHRLVVDGVVKWVRETAKLEFDGAGQLLGGFGITQDITARKLAEEQLREANERYELVLAGAGGAIWDWDVAHHHVLYSSRWKAMRGFAEHEISDAEEEWSRSIHPEDAPRVMAAVQAHFEGRTQAFAEEYRVRRNDGSWFWIADHGLARRDANGRVIRMAGSEVDITERKEAEEALRESESFFRQTLESIPGMVFTTRPDGYCDYQSQQWVEFTGIPMSEHLGDGWNKLLHPDDRPRAFAAWQAAVEGHAPYDLEYRVRRHDGEYEWFKVRGRPIRNAAGEIVRWFGTVLNIDDLVRAKAALERSERLYRGIGESIDYGIWICEPDGRNTYASESFLKLVGLTQEQCSSFGWSEVLHPDDAERTIAAWKECVRTGGTWDIEHRFRGVDGQWHPILARGVPVRDEAGRVLCWAGINLDISRLKGTEEQLKSSLHEKEVLLQEIHHRVKNNLQVISSLINLQTATQTDPALQTCLGDVRDRVRAMALVHEKLYQSADLARLNFADYATSLLQHLWRAHGGTTTPVRLTLDLQPVALPVDTAVPCGLILNELASNALKHAFPNQTGGEVTVGLSQDATSREVCLRVSDNGPGLPPNLNWRESPSLGLRLVQMLAQQLRGTAEIGPGPGTEFRIRFPFAQKS